MTKTRKLPGALLPDPPQAPVAPTYLSGKYESLNTPWIFKDLHMPQPLLWNKKKKSTIRSDRPQESWKIWFRFIKECGMGTLFVLVSPCFRENVVFTCKIWSFLYSLDNLLQKNVIVFFFGNQISKWRSFEKRAIFDLFFTFFSHQGKVTIIVLFSIQDKI